MPCALRTSANGAGVPSPDAKTGTSSSISTSICAPAQLWPSGTQLPISCCVSGASCHGIWSSSAIARTAARCASGSSGFCRAIAAAASRSRFPIGTRKFGDRSRSTPKGLSVSERTLRISARISSGEYATPPITPSPPAFDTAATSSAVATGSPVPATGPMPADRIGNSMPRRSQSSVRRVGRVIGSSGRRWAPA